MGVVDVVDRLSHRVGLLAGVVSLAVLGVGGPALAGTIAAAEVSYDKALLSSFNLVTLGSASGGYSYTNTSGTFVTIGGRAIVNGNAVNGVLSGTAVCNSAAACSGSGNATAAVDGTRQLYGTMTVFGNLVSGAGGGFGPGYQSGTYVPSRTSLGGTTYVGGTASGTLYAGNNQDLSIRGSASGLNVDYADKITTSQATYAGTRTNYGMNSSVVTSTSAGYSAATVFPFSSASLVSEAKNLAAGIANLPGTPNVMVQTIPTSGTSAFITAQNDYTVAGKHYGVVTTTVSELAGKTGGITVDNNGQDATFVIVKGDCPTCLLPTLNSYAGQSKVLFDFVDATALRFAGAWNGSILAPLANITYMGGVIDGTVIVNSINQSQALLANNLFAGDLTGMIPEPTSLALFGVGAAAAGLLRRRRAAR